MLWQMWKWGKEKKVTKANNKKYEKQEVLTKEQVTKREVRKERK